MWRLNLPKSVLLKSQNMACTWFKNQPKSPESCLNILSKTLHSISKPRTVSPPNPGLHLFSKDPNWISFFSRWKSHRPQTCASSHNASWKFLCVLVIPPAVSFPWSQASFPKLFCVFLFGHKPKLENSKGRINNIYRSNQVPMQTNI